MKHYDAIVVGAGGVGSAALYHLAKRGQNVLGIDRFSAAHSRGSSHGKTRIIRKAYFEHPDYVPLLHHAYELWQQLESTGQQQLMQRCGLLQIGPAEGLVIRGVLSSAQQFGLEVEELSVVEIAARASQFRLPSGYQGLFERDAGFLHVEQCVLAHLQQAARYGAELRTDTTVTGWSANDQGACVEIGEERIACERLILTAGPWTSQLLAPLADKLIVRRKPMYWFKTTDDAWLAKRGCPMFLYELPEGIFYGFPQIDQRGVKIAMHTAGPSVNGPDKRFA